jgi:hypothetical protein
MFLGKILLIILIISQFETVQTDNNYSYELLKFII